MDPQDSLAQTLRGALRPGFAHKDETARHLAGLVLDAVDAILPLQQHAPAEGPLMRLEQLAPEADVFSYDGAPGWDVVLAEGLAARRVAAHGPSVLDGLGATDVRDQQRGELKRRARVLSKALLEVGTKAAAEADAGTVVSLHATLLRLFGTAAVSSALLLPEDPAAGALPKPFALAAEIDARQGGFSIAQEEWLARLVADNPAAQNPLFRRFFAGLSQALRTGEALRRLRDDPEAADVEAILGAVGGWQPVRWAELRSGAPAAWFVELCPPAPEGEPSAARLARECDEALGALGRLFTAKDLSLTGFTALYAVFVARCASIAALHEELL